MKRLSDPAAAAVALITVVVLTILVAVLDFSKADIPGIVVGLGCSLIALSVFHLVRKGSRDRT